MHFCGGYNKWDTSADSKILRLPFMAFCKWQYNLQ